jgi:hypothetical protein
MNGKGDVALAVSHGEFDIQPRAAFRLKGATPEMARADENGTLSASVDLDGPAEFGIRRER